MKRLNWKLIIIMVAVLVVTGVTVPIVHSIQTNRNAELLITRAQEARDKDTLEGLQEAARLLGRYLYHRPENLQQRIEHALVNKQVFFKLLEKGGTFPRQQYQVTRGALEEAVSEAVKSEDVTTEQMTTLRRETADFYLKMGRQLSSEAVGHLAALLKLETQRGEPSLETQVQLAGAYVQQRKPTKAIALLEPLLKYDRTRQQFGTDAPAKDHIDAYFNLALAYQANQAQRPHSWIVIDQMVDANESYQAYLRRFEFTRNYVRRLPEDARTDVVKRITADIKQAYAKAPQEREVIVAYAQFAMLTGDFDTAVDVLDKGLKLFPNRPRMYLLRAEAARSQNKHELAVEIIDRGIRKIPELQQFRVAKAKYLLDQEQTEDAVEIISELESDALASQQFRYQIQYLRARVAYLEEKYFQAARDLAAVLPQFRRGIDRNVIIQQLYACYGRLGQTDRQLELLTENTPPLHIPLRTERAGVLLRLGQFEAATEELDRIAKLAEETERQLPLSFYDLRRTAQLNLELRKPKAEQDIDGVISRYVSAIKAAAPKAEVAVDRLKMQAYSQAGDKEKALAILKKLRQQQPKDLQLWLQDTNRVGVEEGADAALKMLTEIEKEHGDSVALRLTRARWTIAAGGDEAAQSLTKLEPSEDDFDKAGRARLLTSLAQSHLGLGDEAKARSLWDRALELQPWNLSLRLRLFEIAVNAGDEDWLNQAALDVEKLTGRRSASWRYVEAYRVLWRVSKNLESRDALAQATDLILRAEKERPRWQALRRLESRIAQIQGDIDKAIELTKESLTLGPASPALVRRLTALLADQQRYDEIGPALRLLNTATLTDEDRRAQAFAKLATGDTEAAVRLARQTTKSGSKDPREFLWLGRLLEQADKKSEALDAYKTATKLDRNNPNTWWQLIRLLISMKQNEQAERVMRLAQLELREDLAPRLLAKCYEYLGNFRRAKHFYQMQLAASPNDLIAKQNAAQFYLRYRRESEAKNLLSEILDEGLTEENRFHPAVVWARRRMAEALADTGNHQNYLDALRLIDDNQRPGSPLSSEDFSLKVRLAASRPDPLSRQVAIGLLEKKREELKGQLPPELRITLARLYERSGRWSEARQLISLVINQKEHQTKERIALYLEMLLRNDGGTGVIARWLEKLEPGSPARVRAEATLAMRRGEKEQAVALLMKLIPRDIDAKRAGLLLAVSRQLEQLELHEQALRVLKAYVSLVPQNSLALVAFKSRHVKSAEDVEEVFGLLEDEQKKGDTNIVSIARLGVETVRKARHDGFDKPEHYAVVRDWFARGLKIAPDSKALLLQLAFFEDLQGNYNEVVGIYEKYLQRTDITPQQRAVVQNNLAFVLALRGDGDRAMNLIEQSISVLGPREDLLDTRAMAYLALGDASSAVSDLQKSIVGGKQPQKRFHLALAWQAAGRIEQARAEMRRAAEDELDVDALSMLEKQRYDQLIAELQRTAKKAANS